MSQGGLWCVERAGREWRSIARRPTPPRPRRHTAPLGHSARDQGVLCRAQRSRVARGGWRDACGCVPRVLREWVSGVPAGAAARCARLPQGVCPRLRLRSSRSEAQPTEDHGVDSQITFNISTLLAFSARVGVREINSRFTFSQHTPIPTLHWSPPTARCCAPPRL